MKLVVNADLQKDVLLRRKRARCQAVCKDNGVESGSLSCSDVHCGLIQTMFSILVVSNVMLSPPVLFSPPRVL